MTQRLKIGYLIPQFPGQTHIFFWREIKALEEMGHEVALFSTRPPPAGLISHEWSAEAMARTTFLADMKPINAMAALARLPLKSLAADLRHEPHSFWRDVLICLPAARRLAHACAAQGITHVHAHSCGRAALIAALANRIYGLRYSISLHGPLSDYGTGQGFKWRHASFATVITQKLMDEVAAEVGGDRPERIVIQPMGVDTEALKRPSPYEPHEKDTPLKLFSCGRLNIVKGHQDLMRAVRILLDQGVDVHLEIAGEDDGGGTGYHQTLQAELEALKLQDRVRLLGAIDGDEVTRKLLAAHIFTLASWHEPLGVAFMEAMSCEVPTIGTDAGGVAELINHGEDGILVPPKDPESLAAAIKAISENPARARELSAAGRRRIVGNFRSSNGAETIAREVAASGD